MQGLVCGVGHRMSRTLARVCSVHRLVVGLRDYNGGGGGGRSLTLSTINQNLRNLRYEVRGKVPHRADEIKIELAAVSGRFLKPYK